MYPYYLVFSEENREYEEGALWFQDSLHRPGPETPFDCIAHEAWRFALSVFNSRIFAVPPAYGLDVRVVNGYQYATTIPVTDPDRIGERLQIFMKRAGHYYRNWDDLFARWKDKMVAQIHELEALEVPGLPRIEDEDGVMSGLGKSRAYEIVHAYDRCIASYFDAWQYHFEMLNIGYAAYQNLFQFCKEAFPGVRDEAIAQMVAGAELVYFQPDDQLKKLAGLALELGLSGRIREPGKKPEAIVDELRADPRGRLWVEALDAAREPWFNVSGGGTMYHHNRSWNDDLSKPWLGLTGYIGRLEREESLDRPTAEIVKRRDRITAEYRELLPSEEDRQTFDQNVGLARLVAGYIEDHAFYHHDWYHTVFFNKIRELGARLVERSFLDDVEDVFYLNRWEVGQALYEMVVGWAVSAPVRGETYWRREVAERKRILDVLATWTPPPALGPVPDVVTDPFAIMLWGITEERIRDWLGVGEPSPPDQIRGVPASPGVAEGRARVIRSLAELGEVEIGEILVCPATDPAWTTSFGLVKGIVTDVGGIMSHAAIVCREFGLPAVVGTGTGTRRISTGDHLRIDGDAGVVTLIP